MVEVPPPPELKLSAEVFIFPEDDIKRWVDIPPDEPLFIGPLTKRDIDNLLFSTARMAAAIASIQKAFIAYSNGDVNVANSHMVDAGNANIEGETHMRKLFYAIMVSVIQGRDNAAGR